MDKIYFHVDLDAFYASVEILDNPQLKGKPVLIGGHSKRGVVSTCSYEARKYGIHSAMPMVTALRLCPKAIVIGGNHKRYHEKSVEVMSIFKQFSPDIQQISIDEAFLDMSGTQYLFGHPFQAAIKLKEKVKQITGLTISVGIGPSKLIAKMASDYNKPDGLCYVEKGREQEFIDAVKLEKLWGVGKVTQQLLKKKHIRTTDQLRSFSLHSLEQMFGSSMGLYLYNIARGIDSGIYEGESKSHSISTERTFIEDIASIDTIKKQLLEMCYEIMYRSIDEEQIAKTIGIKIRYSNFVTNSAQITPGSPIYNAEQIFDIALSLFEKKWKQQPIRLLGVGLYQTYKGKQPIQEDLFDENAKKKRKLEKIAFELNASGHTITKATLLNKDKSKK